MLNTSKLLEVLGNTRNYKGNPADEIKLEEQNPNLEAYDTSYNHKKWVYVRMLK